MDTRTIYITEFDRERLRTLIDDAKRLDRHGNEYLESLELELSRAQVVAPADVPADVVTMNSKVCLRDLDTQEELIMILVFPGDADITQAKISVLAPIARPSTGARVGLAATALTLSAPVHDVSARLQSAIFRFIAS